MSETAEVPQTLLEASQPAAPAWDQSVTESVNAAWGEFSGLVHDQVHLAALEARQAGRSLVAIVAYGVVAALLIVSAWLGLVAALVLVLIAFGVSAWLAMLLGVLTNLAGALGFVLAIRRRSRDLAFPATLRSIRPARAPATPTQAAP